jgi:hemolysin III
VAAAIREFAARELAADRFIHLLGIVLGLVGAIVLIVIAAIWRRLGDLPPILIYAAGLVAMLGCSAAYNVFHGSRWRSWLRRCDHAAIFAMIAGTYTPFTLLGLEGTWSIALTAVIWGVAGLGIAIKLWQPGRIEKVSVALYLALGWIGVVAAGPFIAAFDPVILSLLAAGGILYSSGVVFHVWHRLPYQNAIWHGFVLAAAAVHYAAVMGIVVEA